MTKGVWYIISPWKRNYNSDNIVPQTFLVSTSKGIITSTTIATKIGPKIANTWVSNATTILIKLLIIPMIIPMNNILM